jgi:hypothetical protein
VNFVQATKKVPEGFDRHLRNNGLIRYFFMALPSIILMITAILVAFKVESKEIYVLILVMLAIAFCFEEHVRQCTKNGGSKIE